MNPCKTGLDIGLKYLVYTYRVAFTKLLLLFSSSQFRLNISYMPIQVNQRKLIITFYQNVFGFGCYSCICSGWSGLNFSSFIRLLCCLFRNFFLGGVFFAAVLAFFCGGLNATIGLSSSSSLSTTGEDKLALSLISILDAVCSK